MEQLLMNPIVMHDTARLCEIGRSDESLEGLHGLDPAQRLPQLLHAPRELGAALGALNLVIVGQGSVGAHLTVWAAQVGVRSVVAVDRADVKRTSLLTHALSPDDVGQPKALVAGRKAKALGPRTRVFAFVGDVAELPMHVLANASFILLASDNLLCEATVAQRALLLGIRVLQGSVYGRALTAQVRSVYGGRDGSGPGLCCGYGTAEWAQLDAGTIFSCAGDDAGRAQSAAAPTMSPPHLCSTAASLTFGELLRRATGLESADNSEMIEYSGYGHGMHVTSLTRRAECPLDHTGYQRMPVDARLAERTPRELLRAAGAVHADLRRVTFEVEGQRFASLAACGCRAHPPLGRFLPRPTRGAVRPSAPCARCGMPLEPHPLYVWDELPASLLEKQLDQSLAALGTTAPISVRVRTETNSALFARPFPETP